MSQRRRWRRRRGRVSGERKSDVGQERTGTFFFIYNKRLVYAEYLMNVVDTFSARRLPFVFMSSERITIANVSLTLMSFRSNGRYRELSSLLLLYARYFVRLSTVSHKEKPLTKHKISRKTY